MSIFSQNLVFFTFTMAKGFEVTFKEFSKKSFFLDHIYDQACDLAGTKEPFTFLAGNIKD